MACILVAEDEAGINRAICKNLKLVGHSALPAYDGVEAVAVADTHRIDLALLDVMLPLKDGFSVKEELPPDVPAIFVTAKSGLPDKLKGLGLGADDYITKPFEMLELLARIQVALRRSGKTQKKFVYQDLCVNFDDRRVQRGGADVPLTPQEFNLLETLIINKNLAMSRERLLACAWGYDYEGETRTVDNHIQHLRKKLNLETEIQTVYKMGYRLSINTNSEA